MNAAQRDQTLVHGHPLDFLNLNTWGSTILEQGLVDPKALARMHQKRTPILDKSAGAHIDRD